MVNQLQTTGKVTDITGGSQKASINLTDQDVYQHPKGICGQR